jgi:WD40 repeat protein
MESTNVRKYEYKKAHHKNWILSKSRLLIISIFSLGIIAFLPGSQAAEQMTPNLPPSRNSTSFELVSPIFTIQPAPSSLYISHNTGRLVQEGGFPVIDKDSVDDLEPIMILQVDKADITSIAISPDSTRLASSSVNGELIIWESETGTILHTIEAHASTINSLAFSPDGKYLASGANDFSVKIWDVQEGTLIKRIQSRLAGRILKVRFTPDGKYIAMAGHECLVVLRDVESGIIFKTYKQRSCLPRIGGSVESWGIDFTENGADIILGSGQPSCNCGSIQKWEVEVIASNDLVYGYSIPVKDLDISPNGKDMAIAMIGTNFIRLIDTNSIYPILDLRGHLFRVNDVQFSPNGQLLGSASNDQRIGLWDPNTGELLRLINEHTDAVIAIEFSPDGTYLASASKDNLIILWGITSE